MAKPNNPIAKVKLPGENTQRPIIPNSIGSSIHNYIAELPSDMSADDTLALGSDVITRAKCFNYEENPLTIAELYDITQGYAFFDNNRIVRIRYDEEDSYTVFTSDFYSDYIERKSGDDTLIDGGTLISQTVNIIPSNISNYITGKLDKSTTPYKLYGTDSSGNQTLYSVDNGSANTGNIVRRTSNGRIECSAPSSNGDAANKQYVDNVFREVLNPYEGSIVKLIGLNSSGRINKSDMLISTTWSALKTRRDNSELTPGFLYRITDYICTTSTTNTSSGNHPFDIIVLAIAPNKLSEEAMAIQHEGDSYFANSNLAAWKVWYCLDNDTTRFAWANSNIADNHITVLWGSANTVFFRASGYDSPNDTYPYAWQDENEQVIYYSESEYPVMNSYVFSTSTGGTSYSVTDSVFSGRGVVYRLIDEFNNDVPYDFKNIIYTYKTNFTYSQWGSSYKFIRDESLDDNGYYGWRTGYNPAAWSNSYCFTDSTTITTDSILYSNTSGSIISYGGSITQIDTDNFSSYTFNYVSSNQYYDASLQKTDSNRCYSNKIGPYQSNENIFKLNWTIFNAPESYYTPGLSAHDNWISKGNHDNRFIGRDFYHNIIGTDCYANEMRAVLTNNNIGGSFTSNTITGSCQWNNINYDFRGNVITGIFNSNIFDGKVVNNTFGNKFNRNHISNHCERNVIGDTCEDNYIGTNFSGNTIGDNFKCNFIGSNFGSNVVCDSFSNNTIGNDVIYNAIGNTSATDHSFSYCRFDDGMRFVIVVSANTDTSILKSIQYLHIHLGVQGTSPGVLKTITIPYETITHEINIVPAGTTTVEV